MSLFSFSLNSLKLPSDLNSLNSLPPYKKRILAETSAFTFSIISHLDLNLQPFLSAWVLWFISDSQQQKEHRRGALGRGYTPILVRSCICRASAAACFRSIPEGQVYFSRSIFPVCASTRCPSTSLRHNLGKGNSFFIIASCNTIFWSEVLREDGWGEIDEWRGTTTRTSFKDTNYKRFF